jgi:hypothetical protein
MELHLNDRVELKKPHPCGSRTWIIERVGMDIRLKCEGCGREQLIPRSRAEKAIKRVIASQERKESNG